MGTHAITVERPDEVLFTRHLARCSCGWQWLEVSAVGTPRDMARLDALCAAERHLNHAVDVLGESADFDSVW